MNFINIIIWLSINCRSTIICCVALMNQQLLVARLTMPRVCSASTCIGHPFTSHSFPSTVGSTHYYPTHLLPITLPLPPPPPPPPPAPPPHPPDAAQVAARAACGWRLFFSFTGAGAGGGHPWRQNRWGGGAWIVGYQLLQIRIPIVTGKIPIVTGKTPIVTGKTPIVTIVIPTITNKLAIPRQ